LRSFDGDYCDMSCALDQAQVALTWDARLRVKHRESAKDFLIPGKERLGPGRTYPVSLRDFAIRRFVGKATIELTERAERSLPVSTQNRFTA
jgi:hypothetical protein